MASHETTWMIATPRLIRVEKAAMRGSRLAFRVLASVNVNKGKEGGGKGLPFSHAGLLYVINTRDENIEVEDKEGHDDEGEEGARCRPDQNRPSDEETTGNSRNARVSQRVHRRRESERGRERRVGEKGNRGDVFEDLLRRHLNLFPSGISKPLKRSTYPLSLFRLRVARMCTVVANFNVNTREIV